MSTLDTQKIQEHLQAFRANPVEMMQQIPPKLDQAGNEIAAAGPIGYEQMVTGAWEAGKPMPASWQAAAKKASAELTPLAAVVEYLLKLAQ